MGQIQSGINQIIGQVGLMAHLSPELNAKATKRAQIADLQEKIQGTAGTTQALNDELLKGDMLKKAFTGDKAAISKLDTHMDVSLEEGAKGLALARESFDLEPTRENLQGYIEAKEAYGSMEEFIGNLRMQIKGQQQIKQKHMFQQLVDEIAEAERNGYGEK